VDFNTGIEKTLGFYFFLAFSILLIYKETLQCTHNLPAVNLPYRQLENTCRISRQVQHLIG
ncbi:MAG: hypothetical protein ACYCQI_15320, partial [Gammaproteobacteria bacterium]